MFFKVFIFIFVASLFQVCDSWVSPTWKMTQCRGSEEDSDVFCRRGNYLHVVKATYGRLKYRPCLTYFSKLKQEIDVTKAVQRVCHGTKKCYLYKNAKEIFKYAKSEYDGNEKHLFFNVQFKCKGSAPPTFPPPTQATTKAPEYITRILCQGMVAVIGCFNPPNQVLQILSGTYGRTNSHSCRSYSKFSNDDNKKCWHDVTKYLKKSCDGQSGCGLQTKKIEKDFGNPCENKQTRKFLEVKFKCVSKVQTTPQIATTKQGKKRTTQATQTTKTTTITTTAIPPTTTTTTTTPPTPPPYLRKTLCQGKGSFIGCFTQGSVIRILNATFGRTDPNTCPSSNPRNDDITCYINAVPYTKFQCEGKAFCALNSDPGQYGQACKDISIRSFLDVKYKCVAKGSFTPKYDRTPPLIPSVPTAPSSNRTSNSSSSGHCGRSKVSMSRVVQGTDAKRGSWPWQIAIYTKRGAFICGGSIIAAKWIVTAAHCFQSTNPSDYYVIVGDNNRKTLNGNEFRYSMEQIINHRMYNMPSTDQHDYDISMVKVSRPIRFGQFVQPVCLPTNQQNTTIKANSSRCFVTGWGKAGQLTGVQTTLQQLEMKKVPHAECVSKLATAPGKPGDKITRRMFCATATRNQNVAGVCQGDSGGPFVCHENGQWVLNGVVSWGSPRCAPKDMYGVLADVSEFVSWINWITRSY
ncbi:uncharacterized protein [Clytia hemisphaerica]